MNDASNYESDEDSNMSSRRQKQEAKNRLRNKSNVLLNLNDKSDYSGDEDITTPRGSVIKKGKKTKREKSGILNIRHKGNDGDDLDEVRLG